MITCRHCEDWATESDSYREGDSFPCEACGILGTVQQGDHDVDRGDGLYAEAFLYFEPDDGAYCDLDDCEDCMRRSV